MTTTPMPASVDAERAAFDATRYEEFTATLAECSPDAQREFALAAVDRAATLALRCDALTAERDDYLAKGRAEIDAAVSQLAAARRVIDEERQERALGTTAVITAERAVARLKLEVERLTGERDAYFGAAVGVAQALGLTSLGPVGPDSNFYAEALRFARSLERDAARMTARAAVLESAIARLVTCAPEQEHDAMTTARSLIGEDAVARFEAKAAGEF